MYNCKTHLLPSDPDRHDTNTKTTATTTHAAASDTHNYNPIFSRGVLLHMNTFLQVARNVLRTNAVCTLESCVRNWKICARRRRTIENNK